MAVSRHQHQSGFTIIETMVVIAVFGMAIAAMASFFATLQTTQRNAQYLESATNAAKDEIELLRNSNYTLLAPNTTINFTNNLPNDLPQNKQGFAAISDPGLPNLKRVDVTITYTVGSNNRTVKMTSLIGASGLAQ